MPDDVLRLENQLCFAVYSAAHAFNRVYKPLLERLGLTYPQYLVMMVLWQEDGRTVKSIGDMLFLDSGTLTPLLKRLETAGLVVRRRDPQDERQVRITLTDKGNRMSAEASIIPERIFCAAGENADLLEGLKSNLTALRDLLVKNA